VRLSVLDGELAVCRLPAGAAVPPGIEDGALSAIVRTADEVSIVCAAENAPPGATVEVPWRALKVAGPLDFSMIGIVASLTEPLATAGVSALVIATFDTDYVLVRAAELERAVGALEEAGHTFTP
jgi:hypothetical protein